MKYRLLLAMLLGMSALIFSAKGSAQQPEITDDLVQSFYEDLITKEKTLYEFDYEEVSEKQLEDVARQIIHHYAPDGSIRVDQMLFRGKNKLSKISDFEYDREDLKNIYIKAGEFVKNAEIDFKIKDLKLQGQQAEVDIHYIYNLKTVREGYNVQIKGSWTTLSKATCKDYLKLLDKNTLEITHTRCKIRSLMKDITLEKPKYLEAIKPDAFKAAVFDVY